MLAMLQQAYPLQIFDVMISDGCDRTACWASCFEKLTDCIILAGIMIPDVYHQSSC